MLVNRTLLDMLGCAREGVVGAHVERLLTVGSRIFYQTHWFPLLRMHGRAEEVFLLLRTAAGEEVGVLANAVRRERDGASVYDCIFMRVRERQKFEGELLAARRAAEAAQRELQQQKRGLERANLLLEEQAVELEAQQQQLHEQAAVLQDRTDELIATNAALHARTMEAEQLRTAAEEANRAKSAFLAVMSHELRTPLNAIAGYVQILEFEIPGPITPAQNDILDRIARAGRHLLGLINDVLNLSRIEAGHVEYELRDVSVIELVQEVLPMVEPQILRRQLHLAVAVENGLVVRADMEKAQQLLLNLLGNAVKFTDRGGSITVEAAAVAGAVEIRVIDTGIGIPEDRHESIFKPFVQVDASHTRAAEGSGLGLAISRDLARGMGGDLFLRSRLGVGSTFTLVLPAASPAPPDPSGSVDAPTD